MKVGWRWAFDWTAVGWKRVEGGLELGWKRVGGDGLTVGWKMVGGGSDVCVVWGCAGSELELG